MHLMLTRVVLYTPLVEASGKTPAKVFVTGDTRKVMLEEILGTRLPTWICYEVSRVPAIVSTTAAGEFYQIHLFPSIPANNRHFQTLSGLCQPVSFP